MQLFIEFIILEKIIYDCVCFIADSLHLFFFRPMTFGEVGCFLSHYFIWLKVIAEELGTVLVLEDDIDFQPNFKSNVQRTLREVNSYDPEWDLV